MKNEGIHETAPKLSSFKENVYLAAAENFCKARGPLWKAASAVSAKSRDGIFCLLHSSCDDLTCNIHIREKVYMSLLFRHIFLIDATSDVVRCVTLNLFPQNMFEVSSPITVELLNLELWGQESIYYF